MVVVTSLGPPEEGVRMKVENTAVYINRKQLGMGVLYISEARVSWVGIQGQGFSLEYPHIALHAVSRDLTQFHQECLYLMIDVRLVDEMGTPMSTPTSSDAGSDDSGNEGDSDGGMTEIRFVPDDRNMLDSMFATMSECQALHPDTDDSLEEGEDEEAEEAEDGEEPGMYDDAEEDANGGGNGPEQMDAE
eukprot:GFUD01023610.1.p1 GENE.GFUD01023610.1~~GFUD01023610.1.p1  ORF type:complete len:190 (+),score=75.13 GFUD01023610.1:103-672(+)